MFLFFESGPQTAENYRILENNNSSFFPNIEFITYVVGSWVESKVVFFSIFTIAILLFPDLAGSSNPVGHSQPLPIT